MQRLNLQIVFICGMTAALWGSPQTAFPQFADPDSPESAQLDDDAGRLHTDRRVMAQLQELQTSGHRMSVERIQDLVAGLRAADPMFLVSEPHGTFIPLHRALTRCIQELPSEAVRGFLRDDAAAQTAFLQALESDSQAALVTFLHRYSGTPSSLRAHVLIAAIHADRGNRLAAEYWLEPVLMPQAPPELRRAGDRISDKLKADRGSPSGPSAALTHEPRDADLSKSAATKPSDDKADQPADPKSTQTRASSPGAGERAFPQQYLHWMQSLPLPAAMRSRSRGMLENAVESGIIPWTAWEPVTDANQIYFRTPQVITAWNRQSGKHVWSRPVAAVPPNDADQDDGSLPQVPRNADADAAGNVLDTPEILTLHRNEISGRMSADAERLFAVCSVDDGRTLPRDQTQRLRAPTGQEPRSSGVSELAAIEKSSGRRLWTIGGMPVEEKFGNELANSWFAGPPAVSGQNLYQVLESAGVIRLASLRAATGQLRWSVPLAYPELEIGQDGVRQLFAAQPSVSAGLIFTTTTTGWIAAVDGVTQSLLWIRRLPLPNRSSVRSRSFRSAAYLQTQLQPFGTVWRSEPPHPVGRSLLVATAESSQLLSLDSLNGRLRFRSSVDESTLIVHADQTRVVVASPRRLTALAFPDLTEIWKSVRKSGNAVPAGPGVLRDGFLIVPLIDGTLDVVDIETGILTESRRSLRPPYSAGGLQLTGDSFITWGPDHLGLVVPEPVSAPSGDDLLQQAIFLTNTGQYREARDRLMQLSSDPIRKEQIRQLQYRVALGVYASEGSETEAALEEVMRLAVTAPERAVSEYLRLNIRLKSDDEHPENRILQVLAADDSMLQTEIPEQLSLPELLRKTSGDDRLTSQSLITNASEIRLPFRSWLQVRLRSLLENSAPDRQEEIIRAMAALPDRELLEVRSHRLASEYLRRAEAHLNAGQWNETVCQLLQAAGESAGRVIESAATASEPARPEGRTSEFVTGDSVDEFRRALTDAFDQADRIALHTSRNDPVHRAMTSRLLNAVRRDLGLPGPKKQEPPGEENADIGRTESSSGNRQPDKLLTEVQSLLAEQWRNDKEHPLRMLPVSANGQMGFRPQPVVDIQPLSARDPFVSAYQWSVRRRPGAVLARSLDDPHLPVWSLKTGSNDNLFSQIEEDLTRFGSVLILQNMNGIAAFSVVEQRWLWNRRIPGVNRRLESVLMLNEPFEDFNAYTGTRLRAGMNRRIPGGTHRWICIFSEGQLEILDIMSGNRVWSRSGLKSSAAVLACRSSICVSDPDADPILFHPETGNVCSSAIPDLQELLSKTMAARGDALITWQVQNELSPDRSLKWIHPITGKVTRTVHLLDFAFAQFVDGDTLASISANESCRLVDFSSGRTTQFHFRNPDAAESFQLSRVAVSMDAANYYIYERRTGAVPMMAASMYGIRGEPVEKELRAVSRQTGKLAWTRQVENSLLACISGNSPVMLMVSVANTEGANAPVIPGLPLQSGQRYIIDGCSRITGNDRFRYSVVAQIPFPGLRLTQEPGGPLDLEAFGNRVRYIEVAAVSETSGDSN